MLLHADTPEEFLARHFAGYFRPHFEEAAAGKPHTTMTLGELVAEDWAALRRVHARLVERGSPPPAASTYLSGWFGGIAAGALGYSWVASGGAGFLPTPETIRWYFHPDGWTDRVDFAGPIAVLVPPGHPWAGMPGVTVAASEEERQQMTARALVASVEPIVEGLVRMAKVMRPNLWHEVADGFASALVYQFRIPVTFDRVAAIRGLIDAPGMPWRRKPVVALIERDYGAVCAMHKAGCCLAYTEPHNQAGAEPHEEDHDHSAAEEDDHAVFHRLFADPPGAPAYCANCRLRPIEDCFSRQLWWRDREHRHRAAAASGGMDSP